MGLFTDCLLLLRCLLLGVRCAAGAKDRHGFFAGGKYDEVVCHMTGLGMRSDGHVPKGQKFIAQRQAKRRPEYNVLWSLRPVGAKVLKHRVMFTFALAGRDVIGCGGLPRVSLRLPWAEEVIGLSARLG